MFYYVFFTIVAMWSKNRKVVNLILSG